MRKVTVAMSTVAVLLALTSTAGAQDQTASGSAAPAPPNVTVVAPRKPPRTTIPSPAIEHFVRAHGTTTRIGQLARWRDDVCPTTVGLPPGYNAFVSKRVKEIAASVGAPVKTNGPCRTNVLIVFTTEPQGFLDSIRKRHEVLLGYHYPAQLRRLATFSHPIQSWYSTGTEGSAGLAALPFGGPGGVVLDDSDYGTPGGKPGSHFTVGLSSQILTAVIVADANKVVDLKIGAVADYVGFLALVQTSVSDTCGDLPSITDLMSTTCEDRARPEGLTDGDIAYLKALYAVDIGYNVGVVQSSIADRMQQDIGPK